MTHEELEVLVISMGSRVSYLEGEAMTLIENARYANTKMVH